MNTTDLFECARLGKYPPGTTARDLAKAKQDGWTALHQAARVGHLPPGTKTNDLIADFIDDQWTPLHEAAISGVYPDDITATAMASAGSLNYRTALHTAALSNHLPPGTSLYDLINYLCGGFDTPYECLPEQMDRKSIEALLDQARATTMGDIKYHGDLLMKKNPAVVALWMAREIKRISAKLEERMPPD